MRIWVPISARTVLQRTAAEFTSYDTLFLGLAARLQPAVEVALTLPTVEPIAARSMELTATPSSLILAER